MTELHSDRMPVLFVGHGSPMNAIEDNQWSRGFRSLTSNLPRPKAILCVSAHWYLQGTFVTGNERPETIHDFGGFPHQLYEIQYPAPGDVALARLVIDLIGPAKCEARNDWGLDHGTWSLLVHMYPKADIPVVQLSIDADKTPAEHVAIGRLLRQLRNEGILVLASGNIVHNLRHAMMSYRTGGMATPVWASEFDIDITHALKQHDDTFLTGALASENGRMAQPTPDHYLPMLYAFGAADAADPVSFPITGFDLSSLSMRAVRFG